MNAFVRSLVLSRAIALSVAIAWPVSAESPPAETARPPESAPAPADTRLPAESRLPPGVLARVDGREIRVEEYGSYLLARFGQALLDEYINRLLLDEEARRLEIAIAPETVEAAVEERVRRELKSAFQGSQEAYADWLALRRTTPEVERARMRQDLYYAMLESEVYHRTRPVTDGQVREEFERVHGEGGVELVLRHILVSTREVPRSGGEGGGPVGTPAPPRARTPGEARARAEEIRKEILAGLTFAEAVERYSDDAFTRRNEGRIPRYSRGLLGDRFHEEAMALTPEKPLSEVVESPRGYHVVQLVERRVTRLEDVKAEIETFLRNAPIAPAARQKLLRDLREKARIELP